MQRVGKDENSDEPTRSYHQRQHDLRERLQAQRGKKLRSGAIADGEHEQAEEDRLQQRRDNDGPKLSENDSNDQNAGGNAESKTADTNAPEQCPNGHREEDKNLGRTRRNTTNPRHEPSSLA